MEWMSDASHFAQCLASAQLVLHVVPTYLMRQHTVSA